MKGSQKAVDRNVTGETPVLPDLEGQAMKYKTVVIDPPWPGPGGVANFSRMNKNKHIPIPYVSMTGVQLAAMRIDEFAADDAQIFIWAWSRWLISACPIWMTMMPGSYGRMPGSSLIAVCSWTQRPLLIVWV